MATIVYWPPQSSSVSASITAPATLTLADATTTTAPDVFVIQHTTSGTAAAGFGETNAVELESAGGTTRRVMTDVTKLTTATDAAEVAARTIQLMNAGALADVVVFSIVETNFPAVGTAAAPSVTIGATAAKTGFHGTSGYLCLDAGGVQVLYLNSSSLIATVPMTVPVGSAASPGLTFSTGGLYSVTSGVGIAAAGVVSATLAKTASPFIFTAPAPAIANNTTATEFVGFDANMSRTSTWTAGTATTQREILFRAPTYAGATASATFTTAATVAISAAPIAGTNAIITNAYSLWTQAGTARFDLSDAATNTAPDAIVQKHDTSGTAAASFGLTNAIELESAGGTMRRVVTDAITLTTATDAAEVTKRVIRIMSAGALLDAVTLTPTVTTVVGNFAFGTAGDMSITRNGTNGAMVFSAWSGAGDIVIGLTGIKGTTDTTGFFDITSCAGAPTGVPGGVPSGKIPMQYDTTNNKIWFYNGAWRGVVVA
jgi:hypothetical protein